MCIVKFILRAPVPLISGKIIIMVRIVITLKLYMINTWGKGIKNIVLSCRAFVLFLMICIETL